MITSHVLNKDILRYSGLSLVFLCLMVSSTVLSYGDELDSALSQMASYRFGDNREILSTVEDIVRISAENAASRARLEKEFSRLLTSDASYECKDFICRQLWIIGSDESIPALSRLLADSTTCDIARYALQENPTEEAGKALRNAMKKTSGLALTGIINSLGHRGDTQAIPLLTSCIFDEEKYTQENALAAIAALGRIPSDDAGKVLANARNGGCPIRSKAASAALLIWADTFLADH